MADPAPSAPLPDAASERRVSPADQMAALTGEPVELSQPEADEPAEDQNDASTARQIGTLSQDGALRANCASRRGPRRIDPNETRAHPNSVRGNAGLAASAARTHVPASHPAPLRHAAGPIPPTGVTPRQDQPSPVGPSSPKAQDHPNAVSRSPQGAAPLNATAMVAAALTGGLRRPEPPAAAAPAAVSKAAASNAAASSARERRLPPRSARRQKHSRQSSPAGGKGSRVSDGADAGRGRLRDSQADATAPKAASPAGGLRDKLGVFTADRMQARRDAEEIKGVSQAGTAVLASLEALERQETTGILMKIRDAANANGGIERVLSEMRPGGAFEDLRKEFNVALSHDEGFAAAYEKATSALSSYAETRAGMISAPRPRADINLARLETLDQEIGAAAKTLPGLKDGKNALDEALEGGKEAVEKAFTAIRQAFTRDAEVRGPSPSPRFGP